MQQYYVLRAYQPTLVNNADFLTIVSTSSIFRLIFPALRTPGSVFGTPVLNSIEDLKNHLPSYSTASAFHSLYLGRSDDISLCFSIRRSNKTRDVSNHISLEFSTSHIMKGMVSEETLLALVEDLVTTSRPTLICVRDVGYSASLPFDPAGVRWFYSVTEDNRYPLEIQWMCYFDESLVEFIGKDKFLNLEVAHKVLPLHGGFLVVTTNEPFRSSNALHIEKEKQIIQALNLSRFLI